MGAVAIIKHCRWRFALAVGVLTSFVALITGEFKAEELETKGCKIVEHFARGAVKRWPPQGSVPG